MTLIPCKCDGADGAGARDVETVHPHESSRPPLGELCAELKRQKHVPLNTPYFLMILSFLLVNFHPTCFMLEMRFLLLKQIVLIKWRCCGRAVLIV